MQPPLEDDMPPPLEDDPSFPDDMPALEDAPATVEEPRALPSIPRTFRDDEMFIMDELPPEMIGEVHANANAWLMTPLNSGISTTTLFSMHDTPGG